MAGRLSRGLCSRLRDDLPDPHLPELDHLQKTTLKWAGVVAMLAGVMLAIFGSIVAIRNHHAAMSAE